MIPHGSAAELAPTFLVEPFIHTSEVSTRTCPDPGTAAVLCDTPTQRDWEVSSQLDGPENNEM